MKKDEGMHDAKNVFSFIEKKRKEAERKKWVKEHIDKQSQPGKKGGDIDEGKRKS